jgi:tetratricopeptide (TPR) repeat protein
MRARAGLAMALMEEAEYDEAIGHFQELLRLNPGDNQGNRYHLARCLLEADRLDELDGLLNRAEYKDEFSPEWAYTRTLLSYRRGGDSPEARRQLTEARRANPHVVPLLTGSAEMPPLAPLSYSTGSVDEAVSCVLLYGPAWAQTEGALAWLQSLSAPQEKRAKQSPRGRSRQQKQTKKKPR